jgi:hypothetical protein
MVTGVKVPFWATIRTRTLSCDILRVMPRYPFSDWVAEHFRLTVFPVPGATTGAPETWWESILAGPPEQTSSDARTGSTQLNGVFGPGKLVLKLQPGRIDWLFTPPDMAPGALPDEFPKIGPVTETLRMFSDVAERWLGRDDLPDLARIAFGTVLTHNEADHGSGYTRLPDYLPVRVDPSSSDFSFQINVPVNAHTRIDGLRINRLSKWSVAAFNRISLRVDGTRVAPAATQPTAYALRAELDINTAPEIPGALPRERLIELYRELVALGQEIATEGLLA